MRQIETTSVAGTNHQIHGPIMLDDDDLQAKSNARVVSYEDRVISHNLFIERIDKLGHFQMCHVCEESNLGIQVITTNIGLMCTRCKREGINKKIHLKSI